MDLLTSGMFTMVAVLYSSVSPCTLRYIHLEASRIHRSDHLIPCTSWPTLSTSLPTFSTRLPKVVVTFSLPALRRRRSLWTLGWPLWRTVARSCRDATRGNCHTRLRHFNASPHAEDGLFLLSLFRKVSIQTVFRCFIFDIPPGGLLSGNHPICWDTKCTRNHPEIRPLER